MRVWFWCLLCLFKLCFFLPFGLVIFCWKLHMLDKGNEVNRPFMGNFMLIWQGVGLCLMFTVAAGARLWIPLATLFCLLCWLWAYLSTHPQEESTLCCSFRCNPFFVQESFVLLAKCGGGEAFSNLTIKSLFLIELCLSPVTFTGVS